MKKLILLLVMLIGLNGCLMEAIEAENARIRAMESVVQDFNINWTFGDYYIPYDANGKLVVEDSRKLEVYIKDGWLYVYYGGKMICTRLLSIVVKK